ncbi:hypothetical protein EJ070_07405 [Mesorhizobium sp. M1E.F.Ca.ET.045.02.1.1]|nr:hypothetical protein EJ070_07405 [Mesorhizobium sp. M1E.F.Ca.ET.045.02.1.1]RUW78285.1 hypothetical protein EOA29_25620 [Mesorhizobium sp. M1E.F.Ca.ET.063.01.1.1]
MVIHERYAPENPALREELLRHLMGVPLAGDSPGYRQIAGLGRGPATSNKVFFADMACQRAAKTSASGIPGLKFPPTAAKMRTKSLAERR